MVYLAIEGDDAIHERESAFWLSKGISAIRVKSLNEGIEKASTAQFLYIGINADNINYKPKMKLLRDVTNAPIFIATSTYSREEHVEASSLGADLFGEINDNPADNYKAVTEKLNQLRDRARQPKPLIIIRTFSDILIAPVYHKAFIGDTEITLTKNEMDILDYLMISQGAILHHGQIGRDTPYNELNGLSSDNIYSAIKRLRKKMKDVSQFDYIETIKDVGYRLVARKDKENGRL